MKKNMGSADRIIRIVLALAMVGLYVGEVVTGTIGIVLIVLAVVFAATSMISVCPLYMPFGLSTCKTEKK